MMMMRKTDHCRTDSTIDQSNASESVLSHQAIAASTITAHCW